MFVLTKDDLLLERAAMEVVFSDEDEIRNDPVCHECGHHAAVYVCLGGDRHPDNPAIICHYCIIKSLEALRFAESGARRCA